jgi:hypothetical protein
VGSLYKVSFTSGGDTGILAVPWAAVRQAVAPSSGSFEPPDQLGQLAAGSLDSLLGGGEALAGSVEPAQRGVDLLLQDIVAATVTEVIDRSQKAISTSISKNFKY